MPLSTLGAKIPCQLPNVFRFIRQVITVILNTSDPEPSGLLQLALGHCDNIISQIG